MLLRARGLVLVCLLGLGGGARAGQSFDHYLAGGGPDAVITHSRYDVVIADVVELDERPFTNEYPPSGTIVVREVLRGAITPGRVRAEWRPMPHDVDYDDPARVRRWNAGPIAPPPLAGGQVLVGELRTGVFRIAPRGRFPADKQAWARALIASIPELERKAAERDRQVAERRAAQAAQERAAEAAREAEHQAWLATLPGKVRDAYRKAPEVLLARRAEFQLGRRPMTDSVWVMDLSVRVKEARDSVITTAFELPGPTSFQERYQGELVVFGAVAPSTGALTMLRDVVLFPATPAVRDALRKVAGRIPALPCPLACTRAEETCLAQRPPSQIVEQWVPVCRGVKRDCLARCEGNTPSPSPAPAGPVRYPGPPLPPQPGRGQQPLPPRLP